MKCGSFYIAKDLASKPQGEDGHFICEEKKPIGMADGVGGWSKHGVDAGLYAAELIDNSLLATLTQPLTQVDPMKVLDEAFSKTKAQGSSTACIITLQEGNVFALILLHTCINHVNAKLIDLCWFYLDRCCMLSMWEIAGLW